MNTATYQQQRSRIETYFDRTAAETWARLTSDAPVSRIRATVRAGRDRMRATLLSYLPADLRGCRVLDAGCGTGALAVEAARRGAEVVAIDVAPTLIKLAQERAPRDLGHGRIDFRAGDMLDPALGKFDFAVAMDSLIHYRAQDCGDALASLASRTRSSIVFTFAPKTPLLAAMHAVGQLFPRSDRSPAIQPVSERKLRTMIGAHDGLRGWQAARTQRITAGFYISQALEITAPGQSAMKRLADIGVRALVAIGPRFLPFADVATKELPLGRLMRLSLFQVTVGMAVVLLNGTLNRVMILELGVSSWLVALMVSLPLVFAPLRALVGFRSDTHRSVLGWRRVPYIWFGTMLQFGGFAIMPFALLILSGDTHGPGWIGHVAAALAFLLVGAGLHTTQTAGLALATDLAPPEHRPRVVAFLYVMLLVGMVVSALAFGALLADFSQLRLIQVVQGAAAVTMALNIVALWKQEARDPSRTKKDAPHTAFRDAWQKLHSSEGSIRLLVVVGLGTAAFSMQDILLEPYGGEILHLSVGATTMLTALLAAGTLAGFTLAAFGLSRGFDPFRLAANGLLAGILAFSTVIFASPLESTLLLRAGTALIGFGGGLFAVGTLIAAMSHADTEMSGLAVGAWGAVQATAAGLAIAAGGAIRDGVSALATQGSLGAVLMNPTTGYSVVYHLEIAFLFATLVAIGPLIRVSNVARSRLNSKFGLAELPT